MPAKTRARNDCNDSGDDSENMPLATLGLRGERRQGGETMATLRGKFSALEDRYGELKKIKDDFEQKYRNALNTIATLTRKNEDLEADLAKVTGTAGSRKHDAALQNFVLRNKDGHLVQATAAFFESKKLDVPHQVVQNDALSIANRRFLLTCAVCASAGNPVVLYSGTQNLPAHSNSKTHVESLRKLTPRRSDTAAESDTADFEAGSMMPPTPLDFSPEPFDSPPAAECDPTTLLGFIVAHTGASFRQVSEMATILRHFGFLPSRMAVSAPSVQDSFDKYAKEHMTVVFNEVTKAPFYALSFDGGTSSTLACHMLSMIVYVNDAVYVLPPYIFKDGKNINNAAIAKALDIGTAGTYRFVAHFIVDGASVNSAGLYTANALSTFLVGDLFWRFYGFLSESEPVYEKRLANAISDGVNNPKNESYAPKDSLLHCRGHFLMLVIKHALNALTENEGQQLAADIVKWVANSFFHAPARKARLLALIRATEKLPLCDECKQKLSGLIMLATASFSDSTKNSIAALVPQHMKSEVTGLQGALPAQLRERLIAVASTGIDKTHVQFAVGNATRWHNSVYLAFEWVLANLPAILSWARTESGIDARDPTDIDAKTSCEKIVKALSDDDNMDLVRSALTDYVATLKPAADHLKSISEDNRGKAYMYHSTETALLREYERMASDPEASSAARAIARALTASYARVSDSNANFLRTTKFWELLHKTCTPAVALSLGAQFPLDRDLRNHLQPLIGRGPLDDVTAGFRHIYSVVVLNEVINLGPRDFWTHTAARAQYKIDAYADNVPADDPDLAKYTSVLTAANFALYLLALPLVGTGCDRVFSQEGHLFGQSRNRLDKRRAAALLMTYSNGDVTGRGPSTLRGHFGDCRTAVERTQEQKKSTSKT